METTVAPQTVSRPSIEVSTLITHNNPVAPSPDDDPTGVRALLSALPEPDPMPEHLVERISASLAAEQAKRTASTSGASVTPLLSTPRRRPGRLLFAMAGAAAAVVLVAVAGDRMFPANQPAAVSGSTAAASTSSTPEARAAAAPRSAEDKAATPAGGGVAGAAATPPLLQIRLSETRYTQADFVTQARTLRSATFDRIQPKAVAPTGVGPLATTPGLTDCLSAIGAGGAQLVRADLAVYEGEPAVIIVATTNGIPVAYAVGRQCSHGDAAMMRGATALP